MKIELFLALYLFSVLSVSDALFETEENRNITDWRYYNLTSDIFYPLVWIVGKNFTDLSEPIFPGFEISTLTLNDNLIRYVTNETFSEIKDLINLKLGHNQITTFYDVLTNQFDLFTVALFDNSITELVWDGNTNNCSYANMFSIDLSINQISYIMDFAFAVFCNLQRLLLHSNKIQFLTRYTFSNLSQLQYLFLHSNQLKAIEAFTFFELVQLGNFIKFL